MLNWSLAHPSNQRITPIKSIAMVQVCPVKSSLSQHLAVTRLGLDRTGHVVDKPVIFHVETRAAGLGQVDVVVVNPYGQTEEVSHDR